MQDDKFVRDQLPSRAPAAHGNECQGMQIESGLTRRFTLRR